jgi:hypothetical protein
MMYTTTASPVPTKTTARAVSTANDDFDLDSPVPPPRNVATKTTPGTPASNPYPESNISDKEGAVGTDWSRSYSGLADKPFPKEIADILMAPVDAKDIEIKPGKEDVYLMCSYCYLRII